MNRLSGHKLPVRPDLTPAATRATSRAATEPRVPRLRGLLALSVLAAAAWAWLPAPAHASGPSGPVTVQFVEPENFHDAGRWHVDRNSNLRELQRHLEHLGQRLPEGQTLAIEVLDVNLAGEVWPRIGSEVRVVRGRTDWPQIELRYTLSEDGRTVASGEERVSDPGYLFGNRRNHTLGALPYEKRMLSAWFRERFETQAAAKAR